MRILEERILKKYKKHKKDIIKKPKSTFVLGLDISSTTTGVAIIDKEDDALMHIDDVKMDAKGRKTAFDRSLYLKCYLDELMEYYGNPDQAMIEEPFVGFKGASQKVIRVNGFVTNQLLMKKIIPYHINISSSRKFVGVKGRKNRKRKAFNYIVKKYNLKKYNFKKDNNKTDAVLVALNHNNFKKVIK